MSTNIDDLVADIDDAHDKYDSLRSQLVNSVDDLEWQIGSLSTKIDRATSTLSEEIRTSNEPTTQASRSRFYTVRILNNLLARTLSKSTNNNSEARHRRTTTTTTKTIIQRRRGGSHWTIRWMLFLVIFVYFFYYGIAGRSLFSPETFGFASSSNCEPYSPPTVVSVGHDTGSTIRDIGDSSPQEVRAAVDGFLNASGAAARSVWTGLQGEPVPEKMATWEDQAISNNMGEALIDPAAYATVQAACADQCATTPTTPTPGANLEGRALASSAASAAGFANNDLNIAIAIAGAESSFRADAISAPNNNGSTDHGMWQINSTHASLLAANDWTDAYANARMAFRIYSEAGNSFTPWTVYNTGSYRQFLDPSAQPIADTSTVVPAPVCDPSAPATGEPGYVAANLSQYENGRIPLPALCPVLHSPNHNLECSARNALVNMNNAYQANFGSPICITDSYRTYDEQVSLYASKPSLAARPGTSNHGWGKALDLCGGVNNFGTSQYNWMFANAATYGWENPDWARQSGSRPEAWHWEFVGGANVIAAGG